MRSLFRQPLFERLRQRARRLKTEAHALYLAARHPHTPWYAKLIVAGIVAYIFTPVDLVPDFVPIVGMLDDLILIPLGVTVAVRLVPPAVLAECRTMALQSMQRSARRRTVVVILIWIALAVLCTWQAWEIYQAERDANAHRTHARAAHGH